MTSRIGIGATIVALTSTFAAAQDAHHGGELYRACVACHSLEPDNDLTGPSLAGAFGREAGKAAGFNRYSAGLKAAEFVWDADTLNAWLADPQALIPGTTMAFPGIEDDQARADLVAFLAIAMNVRLKIDSRSTGPEVGKPVITGAGMMGDRINVIFASVADLTRFLVEKC